MGEQSPAKPGFENAPCVIRTHDRLLRRGLIAILNKGFLRL